MTIVTAGPRVDHAVLVLVGLAAALVLEVEGPTSPVVLQWRADGDGLAQPLLCLGVGREDVVQTAGDARPVEEGCALLPPHRRHHRNPRDDKQGVQVVDGEPVGLRGLVLCGACVGRNVLCLQVVEEVVVPQLHELSVDGGLDGTLFGKHNRIGLRGEHTPNHHKPTIRCGEVFESRCVADVGVDLALQQQPQSLLLRWEGLQLVDVHCLQVRLDAPPHAAGDGGAGEVFGRGDGELHALHGEERGQVGRVGGAKDNNGKQPHDEDQSRRPRPQLLHGFVHDPRGGREVEALVQPRHIPLGELGVMSSL
mmetsp:Transcript_19768/g.42754  ORF Transcript_19768/g.42754 Transcript_19768/m.42754 type:complete len:309 (+) Transcript_19768:462-1388(+)